MQWLLVLTSLLAACKGGEDTACDYASPVADAGEDQHLCLGSAVNLDGSASTSSCGLPLNYTWSFSSLPEASEMDDAMFNAASGTEAASLFTLFPDTCGLYEVSLVVSDGRSVSEPDEVQLLLGQEEPVVADCGTDLSTSVGMEICLDGSGSYDPEGGGLAGGWDLLEVPEGAAAQLSTLDTLMPCLVPDVAGSWTAVLVVWPREGCGCVDPCQVTIEVE